MVSLGLWVLGIGGMGSGDRGNWNWDGLWEVLSCFRWMLWVVCSVQ